MINVIKVIAMIFLYNTYNLLYDLYIEPVFDTMTLAYIDFMKEPQQKNDNKYDVINYIKSLPIFGMFKQVPKKD